VRVKGRDKHPLYRYLKQESKSSRDVAANFEKFLVGWDGKVIHRFLSPTTPLSNAIVSAIEVALER